MGGDAQTATADRWLGRGSAGADHANETVVREVSVRPEVTGHASPALPHVAYSVREFCVAHKISVSYYYVLKKLGRAPAEMQFGTRRIISAEAAAAWRAENTV